MARWELWHNRAGRFDKDPRGGRRPGRDLGGRTFSLPPQRRDLFSTRIACVFFQDLRTTAEPGVIFHRPGSIVATTPVVLPNFHLPPHQLHCVAGDHLVMNRGMARPKVGDPGGLGPTAAGSARWQYRSFSGEEGFFPPPGSKRVGRTVPNAGWIFFRLRTDARRTIPVRAIEVRPRNKASSPHWVRSWASLANQPDDRVVFAQIKFNNHIHRQPLSAGRDDGESEVPEGLSLCCPLAGFFLFWLGDGYPSRRYGGPPCCP